MQPARSTWQRSVRGLAVLALLTTCTLRGSAGPSPEPSDKKDPPKPLPKEIVKAWKEAGADVGWMRVDKFDFLLLLPNWTAPLFKLGKMGKNCLGLNP